jgi:ABC-2 type transport system permease protein
VPLVAAFMVVGLVIHGVTMPSHLREMLGLGAGGPAAAATTYPIGAFLMLLTSFVVGAFYSLEALSAERRDRSILFWKSLPVSDLHTVLAKAIVPLVVVPAVTFVTVVVMHLATVLLKTVGLAVLGHSAAPLWSELDLFRAWLALLYTLPVMVLWHAPIYALLLLVSGWARRTAALWVILPLLALGVLEKLTMDTMHVASFVRYRLLGWHAEAFAIRPRHPLPFDPLASLSPGRFLSEPGLWLGLAFAALCIAAAVRLRRYREPI